MPSVFVVSFRYDPDPSKPINILCSNILHLNNRCTALKDLELDSPQEITSEYYILNEGSLHNVYAFVVHSSTLEGPG